MVKQLNMIDQRSANILFKEPDSKYFRFSRPRLNYSNFPSEQKKSETILKLMGVAMVQ